MGIEQISLFEDTSSTLEPANTSVSELDEKIARMAAATDRRNKDMPWDPNARRSGHGWAQYPGFTTEEQPVVPTASDDPLPPIEDRIERARELGLEAEELDPRTLKPLSPEDRYLLR